MRHYFAERDKQSDKPFIRFLDEPDENEGKKKSLMIIMLA
jgi:hypothetical protein